MMRTPTAATLWEIWRVTRVEAAWKLALGTGGGMVVMALSSSSREIVKDLTAAIALILIVMPHLIGWRSMLKLNQGRPGFPLSLHYTRPVRTAVIVGLPMAYLTALSSAIYLVSVLLLRATSGYAFPLLAVAAWIAALTLIWVAATWSTRNRGIQVVTMVCAITTAWSLAVGRLTAVEIPNNYDWPPRLWPTLFDFPLTDYAVIALIAIASFGVAVAGVTRQRHGDASAEVPPARRGGLWGWLVDLFRIPCPTSSATRAQVWLDLKSNGLPVLTIGMALALVNLLWGAVGFLDDAAISKGSMSTRPFAAMVAMFSLPAVLALGSVNAFGIGWKRRLSYFEAIQPYGTAQLTALKLFVRSACVLAAFIAVAVSAWTSVSLLGDEVFIRMWEAPLSSQASSLKGAVAALAGYEQVALAVVAAIGVIMWVAAFAVLGALWTRYSRRMNVAASLLLLCGLALALLLSERFGPVSPFVVDALFAATRWIVAAALILAIAYLSWSGFTERVLTVRYVCIALVISAAFAMAWVTARHAVGVQAAANASSMVYPLLLLFMASVLAPWSFNRVRHT